MAKVAAFYYTQTGQGWEILQSLCRPLEASGHQVIYKEIVPETPFPFPWSSDAFFQAFPESRQGIPCPIRPIDWSDVADAEWVILEYQSWFLSPSIPVHGFFRDTTVRQYLKGKSVITVNGCRNMWIMAQSKVKSYIEQAGGKWVGNIVLQDRYPNLVSVITIIRWLLYGKKEKSGLFPAAGVSAADIRHVSVFGQIISEALTVSGSSSLQERLMQEGAIDYKPAIAFIEKTGHRIFGIWSKFVLRKGSYGAPERAFRLKLFKYYLFVVLYLVSPVGLLFFYLAYPFRLKAIREDRQRQCYV
ncbi:MAG: hypothetical protein LBC40_08550 [Dysgonamonadaceae bacterium]|jgi:hypothetical protein|nr:hypothetical protein [Dysgonamonadaceae bacterium]